MTAAALTLAGAAAGALLPPLAAWLLGLPWSPVDGPARLVTSVPEPWRTGGAAAVGLLGGLALGLLAAHEALTVRVSDADVELDVRDAPRTFTRAGTGLAFRDAGRLVLLAPDGTELAREKSGLNPQRLAAAFTAHGWPWADGDPYGADFRRWVRGAAGLPAGADALFAARERALGAKGDARDARELRAELARLGLVVREESTRQYWRHATPVAPSPDTSGG
nr:hypothetical protein [Streptomyces sp. HNM0574]